MTQKIIFFDAGTMAVINSPAMNKNKAENQLEVNNIEVVYNDIVQVLRGVSLSVPEGSIVALLGTNGAGKTTTLRAISGLLKPENGLSGKDILNSGVQISPICWGPMWLS